VDQDVYIPTDPALNVIDKIGLTQRTYDGRNHALDNSQQKIEAKIRMGSDMSEKNLNPAMSHKLLNYGSSPYQNEGTPLLKPARSEHRLQVKGVSSVRSLHHGSQSVGSLQSHQPSTVS